MRRRRRRGASAIPFNKIAAAPSRTRTSRTLDDKNTFALNNAGRDRDGVPGIDDRLLERCSVTGRRPQPTSSASARPTAGVAGHAQTVSASRPAASSSAPTSCPHTRDRVHFYVRGWPSISGAARRQRPDRDTDGQDDRRRADLVGAPHGRSGASGVPNVFPRQAFRNLSLPIGARRPVRGEVYLHLRRLHAAAPQSLPTWTARPGLHHADRKSRDGGATWKAPRPRSTTDATNADQFQPYLRVTPGGQRRTCRSSTAASTARTAEPSGERLHRHLAGPIQRRRATWSRDPRLARLLGSVDQPAALPLRRVHRRLPGAWWPTTASRRPFVNDTHLAQRPGPRLRTSTPACRARVPGGLLLARASTRRPTADADGQCRTRRVEEPRHGAGRPGAVDRRASRAATRVTSRHAAAGGAARSPACNASWARSRTCHCLLCRGPAVTVRAMATTADSRPEARLRRQAQALHLHRRARAAARVDPRASPPRSSRPTPRSGRRRRSPTRSSRAWASSASSASTSPSSTAARAATTTRALVLAEEMVHARSRRPGHGRRRPHRHGDAADPRLRHRGAEAGVGRARDQGREDPVPRHHRARRRLRRRRHQDARGRATATSTSSTAPRPTSPTATAPT